MGERRRLRELGVRALYQAEVVGEDVEDALKNVLDSARVSERGKVYLTYILDRFVKHQHDVDAAIEAQSQHWTLKRMAATDRNVLRWAASELWFSPDVPRVVVIDEAIELAKELSGQESGKFVNGILDRLPVDPGEVRLPGPSPGAPEAPEEIRRGREAREFEVEDTPGEAARPAKPRPRGGRGGRGDTR